MDLDTDDLDAWIADLGLHIAHGEFAALPWEDLSKGIRANAKLAAQIVLSEFDGLADLSREVQDCPDHVVKRRSLLGDLLWLHQQIGTH